MQWSNIANNFNLIPNHNVDSIWIRNKSLTQGLHMGFFYCSPENSSMQSTFFDTVNKEIQLYSNTHNTYIFGDFNARIQTLCENMPADKFDEQVGICGEMESIPPPRNSEDLKSNTRISHIWKQKCW